MGARVSACGWVFVCVCLFVCVCVRARMSERERKIKCVQMWIRGCVRVLDVCVCWRECVRVWVWVLC